MLRVFSETVGRYQVGEVKDWPRATWDTFFPDWKEVTAEPEVVQRTASKRAATRKDKSA